MPASSLFQPATFFGRRRLDPPPPAPGAVEKGPGRGFRLPLEGKWWETSKTRMFFSWFPSASAVVLRGTGSHPTSRRFPSPLDWTRASATSRGGGGGGGQGPWNRGPAAPRRPFTAVTGGMADPGVATVDLSLPEPAAAAALFSAATTAGFFYVAHRLRLCPRTLVGPRVHHVCTHRVGLGVWGQGRAATT